MNNKEQVEEILRAEYCRELCSEVEYKDINTYGPGYRCGVKQIFGNIYYVFTFDINYDDIIYYECIGDFHHDFKGQKLEVMTDLIEFLSQFGNLNDVDFFRKAENEIDILIKRLDERRRIIGDLKRSKRVDTE